MADKTDLRHLQPRNRRKSDSSLSGISRTPSYEELSMDTDSDTPGTSGEEEGFERASDIVLPERMSRREWIEHTIYKFRGWAYDGVVEWDIVELVTNALRLFAFVERTEERMSVPNQPQNTTQTSTGHDASNDN